MINCSGHQRHWYGVKLYWWSVPDYKDSLTCMDFTVYWCASLFKKTSFWFFVLNSLQGNTCFHIPFHLCLIWCYAMHTVGAKSFKYSLIRNMHKGISECYFQPWHIKCVFPNSFKYTEPQMPLSIKIHWLQWATFCDHIGLVSRNVT